VGTRAPQTASRYDKDTGDMLGRVRGYKGMVYHETAFHRIGFYICQEINMRRWAYICGVDQGPYD
jgi:hypothetical protein